MFRYYLGIAIICAIFAVFSLILSDNAAAMATIMVGFSGAFMAIGFISSGPESRW